MFLFSRCHKDFPIEYLKKHNMNELNAIRIYYNSSLHRIFYLLLLTIYVTLFRIQKSCYSYNFRNYQKGNSFVTKLEE